VFSDRLMTGFAVAFASSWMPQAHAQAAVDPVQQACIADAADAEDLCTFWYSDERWAFAVGLVLGPSGRASAQAILDDVNTTLGAEHLTLGPDAEVGVSFRERRAHRHTTFSNQYFEGLQAGPGVFLTVVDDRSPNGELLLSLPPPTSIDLSARREVRTTLTGQMVDLERLATTDIGTFSVRARYSRTETEIQPAVGTPEASLGGGYFGQAVDPVPIRQFSRRGVLTYVVDGGVYQVNALGDVVFEVDLTDPVLQSMLGDPDNVLMTARETVGHETIFTVLSP